MLTSRFHRRNNHRVGRRQIGRRLSLISLEERAVPASFTVTNTTDGGLGSLRQAIVDANSLPGADSISFDPIAFAIAQTIGLTSGEMSISETVSISGPGANLLTLTGGPIASATNRFFNIGTTGLVSISGMRLTQGQVTGDGGAIFGILKANIQLSNLALDNNNASKTGGAVSQFVLASGSGHLDIFNSTFSNNSSGKGGAIACPAGLLTITNSTLVGNTAGSGGAIWADPTARNLHHHGKHGEQ